jgi:hypothetical protein
LLPIQVEALDGQSGTRAASKLFCWACGFSFSSPNEQQCRAAFAPTSKTRHKHARSCHLLN